jgi:hypothetical protein
MQLLRTSCRSWCNTTPYVLEESRLETGTVLPRYSRSHTTAENAKRNKPDGPCSSRLLLDDNDRRLRNCSTCSSSMFNARSSRTSSTYRLRLIYCEMQAMPRGTGTWVVVGLREANDVCPTPRSNPPQPQTWSSKVAKWLLVSQL